MESIWVVPRHNSVDCTAMILRSACQCGTPSTRCAGIAMNTATRSPPCSGYKSPTFLTIVLRPRFVEERVSEGFEVDEAGPWDDCVCPNSQR